MVVDAAQWITPFALGAGAGWVAARVARRVRARRHVTVTGALCVAVVVALAALDISEPQIGRWWANRPMLAALVNGSLFLVLTVLFVEVIVERFGHERSRVSGRVGCHLVFDTVAHYGKLTQAALEATPAWSSEPWGADDYESPIPSSQVRGALVALAEAAEDLHLGIERASTNVGFSMVAAGLDNAHLHLQILVMSAGGFEKRVVRAVHEVDRRETISQTSSNWSFISRGWQDFLLTVSTFDETCMSDLGDTEGWMASGWPTAQHQSKEAPILITDPIEAGFSPTPEI